MATILHEGDAYRVTDAWHEANTSPWPHLEALNRQQCDDRRWQLLNLSNERALTGPEHLELMAVTNHYNVRNALKFLGGRPHTDFGFEGADQVHGNVSRHACGCELHHVFDHHASQRGEEVKLHPHTPRHVCKAHEHLRMSLDVLHATVAADNASEA